MDKAHLHRTMELMRDADEMGLLNEELNTKVEEVRSLARKMFEMVSNGRNAELATSGFFLGIAIDGAIKDETSKQDFLKYVEDCWDICSMGVCHHEVLGEVKPS